MIRLFERTIGKIFNFKKCFCFPQIKLFEKQECVEERRRIARDIYDNFIMKELLAHSHVSICVNMCFLVKKTCLIFPKIYTPFSSLWLFLKLLSYVKLFVIDFHLIHIYLLLYYISVPDTCVKFVRR